MESVIKAVKRLMSIYKKDEDKFNLLMKFLAGVCVFVSLSGLANGQAGIIRVVFITIVGGILTAVASPFVFMMLAGVTACFYVSVISIEAALFVFVVFFLIFVFYIRIFPKESLIIPLMLAAYFLKIPYIVPILTGLYVGINGMGAILIAVFLHSNLGFIDQLAKAAPRAEFTPMGVLDNGIKMLETLASGVDLGWIFIAAVFIVAGIAAMAISNMFVNNEGTLAIVVSGIIMVVGTVLCIFFTAARVSVIGTMIGVPIACAIAYIIQAVDFVLDYPHAERVKFQDANYVYYVKAVPKIKK